MNPVVIECDRQEKTVAFEELSWGDGPEHVLRLLNTNLHALTLGLAGWRVNGVRVGDPGLNREWVEAARSNTALMLARTLIRLRNGLTPE